MSVYVKSVWLGGKVDLALSCCIVKKSKNPLLYMYKAYITKYCIFKELYTIFWRKSGL